MVGKPLEVILESVMIMRMIHVRSQEWFDIMTHEKVSHRFPKITIINLY